MTFQSWEETILNFFEKKKMAEEKKYIELEIKKIAELYKKDGFFKKTNIKDFFDTRKNKKIKDRSSIDFLRLKLEQALNFHEKPKGLDSNKIKEDYKNECNKILEKFIPHKWLSENALNAAKISFATHVIKLTHSKIDSTSFIDQVDSQKLYLVSTSSLKIKPIDAVCSNEYAPIYQFLALDFNGTKLSQLFYDTSNKVLKFFAENNTQLEEWNKGFNSALTLNNTNNIASHLLAKQCYFPIKSEGEKNSYHLLCPMKSSSMIDAVFEKLKKLKETKNLKDNNNFLRNIVPVFSQTATIAVTASNPGNASQLNGKRGGVISLFSTCPPVWKYQLKPPISKESLFYSMPISPSTEITIDYLRNFLIQFQRAGLSIKDQKSQKWIIYWVKDIVDNIFAYVSSIQKLQPGWSIAKDIKLKKAHQYLLDPYFIDKRFQTERKTTDWQTVIWNDFSEWLNRKLIGEEKQFTPQSEHKRLWVKLMRRELRIFNQLLELEIETLIEESL